MIEFQTLGALDLRGGPDERRLRSVLSRVKRVGLLAYLVLARPRGFHRRDTLLAIFWPESSESRARHALNQATYVLRRALGPGVIEGRGSEELGVVPDTIRCDAVAFDAALDAGDAAAALELYGGELLPGFYVPDGSEFERWLERERTRLRDRARAAALSLAEEADAAGNTAAMLRWARHGRSIAPDDERVARALIAGLDRAGDRAGALREYDRLATRLAHEYESEPAPETAALVAEIRARATSRSTGSTPSTRSSATSRSAPFTPTAPTRARDGAPRTARPTDREGADGVAVGGARPASRDAAGGSRSPPSRVRVWRRRMGRTAPAAAAAVLAAAAWLVVGAVRGRTPTPAAGPSATRVAVLPFTAHGGDAYGYLRDGLAGLIATSFNGIGTIRSVDSHALVEAVGPTAPAPREAAAVADRFDADLFVLGDVVENDRRLRITAALYDRSSMPRPVVEVTAEGAGDELFRLVDEMTLGLLRGLGGARSTRPAGLAALTTSSLPALRAYLEGRDAARAGRYGDAIAAYTRAIDADSTFALAYYGLSQAANWEARYGLAKSAAAAAVRHGERLSRHDRLHAQAWHAYLGGAGDLAERLYRTIIDEDPADARAWFYLGEVTFHWGPMLGRPPSASRASWERVLDRTPDHAGALIHLIRIAALERRPREVDTLTTRLLALSPGAVPALEARALRAFVDGGPDDRARFLAQAEYAADDVLHSVARSIASFAGDPAGAARLFELVAARTDDPERRRVGRLMLVQLEAASGRWDAATAALADVAEIAPGWALEYRAVLASLPFHIAPPAELERLRARLLAADRDGAAAGRARPAADGTGALPRGAAVDPARRLYLLGLVSHRLGDAAAAADYLARLERFHGGEPQDSAFAADFARALRAERADSPAEALAILGEPRLEPDSMFSGPLSYPKAHERWLRAESLRALGRTDEALDWYATFPAPTAYDLMYVAPSHGRRAELYRALGDSAAAAWHGDRARALRRGG